MSASGDEMSTRSHGLQSAAPRSRGWNTPRLLPLARVMGLVVLFLLPMQMRAGVDDPHPHALLQLILDARDGTIGHHTDDGHKETGDSHARAGGAHEPDVPVYGESNAAGGSMAVLAALTVFFLVPACASVRFWPPLTRWSGRIPALDPPPPRIGRR